MIFRSRLGSILDEALGIGGEHLDGLGNRGANISDAKNQSGQDVAQVGGGVAAIGFARALGQVGMFAGGCAHQRLGSWLRAAASSNRVARSF